MWLLSTKTAKLRYMTGPDDKRLWNHPYAILSHVWQEEEQSFQDIQALYSASPTSPGDTPLSRASPKIRHCCMLARSHGYRWVWIDTCCINKESSSELSEAINSMYDWYSRAAVCYVYLYDVFSSDLGPRSQFYKSRWFTRGWTLQELIAPTSLLFLRSDWSILGTRTELANHVVTITSVDKNVLLHRRELGTFRIAQRMSWAASRQTTRIEDRAYCLMGIFGVNMPTLYGEGSEAFYRLQEEIMKVSTDQTIFAWGHRLTITEVLTSIKHDTTFELARPEGSLPRDACLLAPSPDSFLNLSDLEPIPMVDALAKSKATYSRLLSSGIIDLEQTDISHTQPMDELRTCEFSTMPQGMRSTLPVMRFNIGEAELYIAILGCKSRDDVMGLLLYRLTKTFDYQDHEIYASDVDIGFGLVCRAVALESGARGSDSTTYGPGSRKIISAYNGPAWSTIYVLHRPYPYMLTPFLSETHEVVENYHYSSWSLAELRQRGFHPERSHTFSHNDEISGTTTFRARTDSIDEVFTVDLRRCKLIESNKCRSSGNPLLVSVTFNQKQSLQDSISPRGADDDTDLYDCTLDHVGQEQDWTKKFGDESRVVEVTIGRRGGRDLFIPHYIIDVRISGKVYMSLPIHPMQGSDSDDDNSSTRNDGGSNRSDVDSSRSEDDTSSSGSNGDGSRGEDDNNGSNYWSAEAAEV